METDQRPTGKQLFLIKKEVVKEEEVEKDEEEIDFSVPTEEKKTDQWYNYL